MARINKNIFPVLRITCIVIFILISFNLVVKGQYDANLVKAAYIERMIRYVDWPVKNSDLTGDSFVIGVFVDPVFYKTLSKAFSGKIVKDHAVKVIQVAGYEQLNTCNLCYISEKANSKIIDFVNQANLLGVLLISETSGFGKEGVHINFYIEDEKLKFEINEKSISSGGFKVSYLLMQNSKVVQ